MKISLSLERGKLDQVSRGSRKWTHQLRRMFFFFFLMYLSLSKAIRATHISWQLVSAEVTTCCLVQQCQEVVRLCWNYAGVNLTLSRCLAAVVWLSKYHPSFLYLLIMRLRQSCYMSRSASSQFEKHHCLLAPLVHHCAGLKRSVPAPEFVVLCG